MKSAQTGGLNGRFGKTIVTQAGSQIVGRNEAALTFTVSVRSHGSKERDLPPATTSSSAVHTLSVHDRVRAFIPVIRPPRRIDFLSFLIRAHYPSFRTTDNRPIRIPGIRR
jgi:hypothetical protein